MTTRLAQSYRGDYLVPISLVRPVKEGVLGRFTKPGQPMLSAAQVIGHSKLLLGCLVGIAHHLQIALIDLLAVDKSGVVGCSGSTPAPGLHLQLRAPIRHFH